MSPLDDDGADAGAGGGAIAGAPSPSLAAEATAMVTVSEAGGAAAAKGGGGRVDDVVVEPRAMELATAAAAAPAPPPPPSPRAKPPQDRDFSAFPHRPYPIQTAFMQALYSALDERRLALFESPTGTGKTLSLVVGALTWLEDKRRAAEEASAGAEAEEERETKGAAATTTTRDAADFKEAEDLPPWLAEAAAERAREARGAREERRQRRLRKARERRDAALAGVSRAEWAARARRRAAREAAARAAAGSTSAFSSLSRAEAADRLGLGLGGGGGGEDDEDEQFLINSDDGGGDEGAARLPDASSHSSRRRSRRALSPAVSSSSDDDDGSSSDNGPAGNDDDDDEAEGRIRVVVASRTHSQLSQFVGELRRTRFADSVAAVALGSRAQLCVNDKVLGTESGGKGFSAATVAERCRDLQKQKRSAKKPREGGGSGAKDQKQQQLGDNEKGKAAASSTKAACGCPFRSNPDAPGARRAMRDALLARPTDVEESAAAGRALGACPYYASRAALPDADVVFVPYAGLLSADAREAVGLRLRGAVVVVDEAHNLPAAVAAASSARVTAAHLSASARGLRGYLERFGPRLSPSGRRDVQMLLAVSESLGRWLREGGGGGGGGLSSAATAPSTAAPSSSAAANSQNNQKPPPQQQRQQRALTIDAFVSSAGLDNINTFRLVQSLKEKHAVAKVAGAADAAAARERRKASARAAEAAEAAAAAGGSVRPSGRRRGKKGNFPSSRSFASRRDLEDGENNGSGGSSGSDDPTPTAALHALVSFAAALTTADADGRVVVERGPGGSSDAALRFVLLNAGARFGAVLAEARAVVLASGTLEPSASLAAQLFPPPPPPPQPSAKTSATTTTTAPRLPAPQAPLPPAPPPLHSSAISPHLATAARFSCGHVLPKERLLALSLGAGPTGRPLDLRASARTAPASLDEVGALLANVCAVVPGGVVAFFPSFAYLAQAAERWRATGAMLRMEAKKRVFVEPRGAAEVAPTLAAFGRAARGATEEEDEKESEDGDGDSEEEEEEKKRSAGFFAPVVAAGAAAAASLPPRPPPPPPAPSSSTSGALLLSVIGAKLSEGINFGDALGRAVVVLGIPYPAPDDAELVERMSFLEKRSKGAGRALYEDSAAVAVNQCVGRVVRHARDWAAVILADVRYTKRSASASGSGGGGGGGGVAPPPTLTTTTTSSSSSAFPPAPASVPPAERLPGWMKPSLRIAASYGEAHAALARFCREMTRRDKEEEEEREKAEEK